MRIFLLTSVYATTTGHAAATPVVHYFAKEWVKQGHEVTVFHLDSSFPSLFYNLSSFFHHSLSSFFNLAVPVDKPVNYRRTADGVDIHGIIYKKIIPHSRISNHQLKRIVSIISKQCDSKGIPDIFIGHWDNPQLEILPVLKQRFGRKTCLVLHNNVFSFSKRKKKRFERMIKEIDIIGFRNQIAKNNYVNVFGNLKRSFIAYSGVSSAFIENGKKFSPVFTDGVSRFIYVGMLIERKHPANVLCALQKSYKSLPFELTYIGDGFCKSQIEQDIKRCDINQIVNLPGRLRREDIIDYLKNNQVFVMISEGEIFGLVYLEAMAMGLIPIGSRGEGIDGIIKDGENGFLCEPGNTEELISITERLRHMSTNQLEELSKKAKATALLYSDSQVAKHYIDSII